jgi:hypothetical protein
MEKLWKDYGLSITLAILFLVSWAGQGVFQWMEFAKTQEEHGQPVLVKDFQPEFLARTFENWQSEFLQLFTFVTLTTVLIHKGSPESKDGDEEMKKILMEIKNNLKNKKKK